MNLSHEQFIDLIRRMRLRQKEFFAAQYGSDAKKHAVIAARSLEKQVDAEVEKFTAALEFGDDGGIDFRPPFT